MIQEAGATRFCSEGCRRSFLDPERELRQMGRRMGLAISGVLLALLLWMTWGVWLFVLTTPVQFIGGWGFYRGAWAALRSRSLNMDVLIALGTSVVYGYSVLVVFAPQWLPVAGKDAKDPPEPLLGLDRQQLGRANCGLRLAQTCAHRCCHGTEGAAMALSSLSVIVNSSLLNRSRKT